MSAHSLSSLGFVLLYSVFVISVNPQWVNYISKYNGVPISWNRLFWAGNQGNNQNFDPSLLGCLKQAKNALFVFLPVLGLMLDCLTTILGWATLMPFASIYPTDARTNPWNFREKVLRIGGEKKLSLFESAQWKSVNIYTKIAYSN